MKGLHKKSPEWLFYHSTLKIAPFQHLSIFFPRKDLAKAHHRRKLSNRTTSNSGLWSCWIVGREERRPGRSENIFVLDGQTCFLNPVNTQINNKISRIAPGDFIVGLLSLVVAVFLYCVPSGSSGSPEWHNRTFDSFCPLGTAPAYSPAPWCFACANNPEQNGLPSYHPCMYWGLYPLNKKDYNPHNNPCQYGGNEYDLL